MASNPNCLSKLRLFKVTGSHVHCKSDSISDMVQDSHVLLLGTNLKCYMAYPFLPFPVTLNDPEGHSPVAALFKCNSKKISATLRTVSSHIARPAVP